MFPALPIFHAQSILSSSKKVQIDLCHYGMTLLSFIIRRSWINYSKNLATSSSMHKQRPIFSLQGSRVKFKIIDFNFGVKFKHLPSNILIFTLPREKIIRTFVRQ